MKYFPCVVKPFDSQGQRGVQLIENKEDFVNAALAIKESKSGNIIVFLWNRNVVERSSKIKVIVNGFTERHVHGVTYFDHQRVQFL